MTFGKDTSCKTRYVAVGVRGFEFDVHDDSKVGQYAYSAYLKLAGQPSLISPDLLKPGLKVTILMPHNQVVFICMTP